MDRYRFRFLVVLMSLALVGIILIQLYWIETTFDNNKRQFQYLVNKKIVYSNIISFESLSEDLGFNTFIDSVDGPKNDYKNYVSRRRMEIYHGDNQITDGSGRDMMSGMDNEIPDQVIVNEDEIDMLNRIGRDIAYNDILSTYPIERRMTVSQLNELLKQELQN